jgi:hypothetical protein
MMLWNILLTSIEGCINIYCIPYDQLIILHNESVFFLSSTISYKMKFGIYPEQEFDAKNE